MSHGRLLRTGLFPNTCPLKQRNTKSLGPKTQVATASAPQAHRRMPIRAPSSASMLWRPGTWSGSLHVPHDGVAWVVRIEQA